MVHLKNFFSLPTNVFAQLQQLPLLIIFNLTYFPQVNDVGRIGCSPFMYIDGWLGIQTRGCRMEDSANSLFLHLFIYLLISVNRKFSFKYFD